MTNGSASGSGRATILHRTPIHPRLLEMVRDGRIEWRTQIGACGGFAPVDSGLAFAPGHELVAMYELRNAGLIKVDAAAGKVSITREGLSRLTEWSGATGPARLSA